MNNKEVPVFKSGPNGSVVFHHNDLDGYNGAQVCYKWLKEKIGEDHDINMIPCGYEHVNPFAEEEFEKAENSRYIIFVDISINEELAKTAPDNVFIFDHHDTSDYLDGMSDHYYWNGKYCGSVVAWKALFGGRKDKKFLQLLKICNNYDLWKGDDGQPPQLSFDMNALFWNKPSKWFTDFFDGFDGFTKEQKEQIEYHWQLQEEIFEKYITKVELDNVIFIEGNPKDWDCNFCYNKLIRQEGYNVVFHWRADRERVSVRTSKDRMDWWHAGEWLSNNIHNIHNSKGGHRHAAGCSTDGMEMEEVFENVMKIEEECQQHFGKKAEA